MNGENTTNGKRLSRTQAAILIAIGLIVGTLYRTVLNKESIIVMLAGTAAEIIIIYSLISLFTKKGLRWR